MKRTQAKRSKSGGPPTVEKPSAIDGNGAPGSAEELRRELSEAREQQAALSEILRVIAASPSEIQPVLDAIAENAMRYCGVEDALVHLREGDTLRPVAHSGIVPEPFAAGTVRLPVAADTTSGRAVLEKRTITVEDLQTSDEYPRGREMARATGHRATLATPLLRAGEAIGVILLRRLAAAPFTQQQVKLVEAFASQAVIAIENVRLFNETKEALERQTATAEILRLIAASPTDVQPVLEGIAQSAARFCSAENVTVVLLRNGQLYGAAAHGPLRGPRDFVWVADRTSVSGRAVIDGRTVHVVDLLAESDDDYATGKAIGRELGVRTTLASPLVREGVAIGALLLRRDQVKPFTAEQIELVETFAAQAVIAMENVRLFNETKEALEQQTASAEILRVIAGSPTDVLPVLQAIAESAADLCAAEDAAIGLVEGDMWSIWAHHGPVELLPDSTSPVGDQFVSGHAMLERRTIRVDDLQSDVGRDRYPGGARVSPTTRAIMATPLLRQGNAIGAIFVRRSEALPFTDSHAALIEAFASQAVIAIENVRLFNETKEALEQQTATAEILRAISGSPTDVQPVLDAIATNAVRYCGAEDAALYLIHEGRTSAWAHVGPFPDQGSVDAMQRAPSERPTLLRRDRMMGRVLLDRVTIHLADVQAPAAIAEFPDGLGRAAEFPFRAALAAPLRRGDDVIGTILLRRKAPGPFAPEQIELVETFAAQAVIAIENVRLFNETKEALERQTAVSQILRVISASPSSLQPVFDAIAEATTKFCGAEDAAVMLISAGQATLLAHYGPMYFEVSTVALDRDTVTGSAILEKRTIQVEDVMAGDAFPRSREIAGTDGQRTVLATPLIRAGEAIGAIVLRRAEARAFTDRQVELVETFADQAVIAIENVRLFNETKEALDQQTAVSGVLQSMSRSAFDLQRVLETLVEQASRLCDAERGSIHQFDGDAYRTTAFWGDISEEYKRLALDTVRRPGRETLIGRTALERDVVHLPDVLADPEYTAYDIQRVGGYRTMLGVPLLRDGFPIGVFVLTREAVRPFTDRQIELVKTFADQAVIAIENVRLFTETKEALGQQTATSEVLKVISQSAFDLQPVLDAVVQTAGRLARADAAWMRRVADGVYLPPGRGISAHWAVTPELAMTYETTIGGLVGGEPGPRSIMGHALRERRTIHADDVAARDDLEGSRLAMAMGARTVLAVPLLRQGEPLGFLVLAKVRVEPFTDREIQLVETFANQAVIAIENVRLFNETKEALEQQTATANVLDVISRSAFDIAPVLQIIADSSLALCRADHAVVWQRDGNEWFYDATAGDWAPNAPSRLDRHVWQAGGPSTVERAIESHRAVHLPDVLEDSRLRPESGTTETRTRLAVPIQKDGEPIGAIQLGRREMEPFSGREIELVESFATQAAIAIENVRLFTEIQDKSKQLEVASRHKSEFLANMSHELRTPLNAIIGFTDVMLEEMFGPLNDKQKEYLDDVRSSGTHLLTLINDILDLSKVEAGRIELEVGEFSLPDALENAITLVRERATRHGITLASEIAKDVGIITADERKIKQILVNLLANAVKFTPDGGWVSVAARRANGEIEVAVRDTGIGVATEDQGRIFDEFQQVGRDPDRSREGTGLGLTLAKRFVELHGGRIWVESEVGKGSTFTFAIPLRQTALADAKG